TRRLPCFDTQSTVGGTRRMGNGALRITQVGGDGDQASGIDEPPCGLTTTTNFKTDHSTKSALLRFGQLMLRVTGQPGIVDMLDVRLLIQPLGQFLSSSAMGCHAQTQRFQSLEE